MRSMPKIRTMPRQASKIVKEQGYEARDLKAYPYGFVMHRSRIAGTLEIEEPVL